MNKRFSTFAAMTALAMGSLFTANAVNLSEAIPGKYYELKVVGVLPNPAPASAQQALNYFVNSDLKLVQSASNLQATDLWSVEVKKEGNVKYYKLVNSKGGTLNVLGDGNTWFGEHNEAAGFELISKDGSNSVFAYYGKLIANDQTDPASAHLWALQFDLQESSAATTASQTWTVAGLNGILGNGFGLQISQQVVGNDGEVDFTQEPVEYTDLQGNPFTGVLYAEGAAAANTFVLRQGSATGNRIVVTAEKWGSLGEGNLVSGYVIKAVDNVTYNKLKSDNQLKADQFSVKGPFAGANGPLEVSCTVDGVEQELIVVGAVNDSQTGTTYRLTVAPSVGTNNVAGEAGYTYYAGNKSQNTWVRFGLSNAVDYAVFYDQLWNIQYTDKDNKSFAITPDAKNSNNAAAVNSKVPVKEVANDQPEGQWLYIGNNAGNNQFKNRESGKVVTINGLRNTDAANVYAYTDGGSFTITSAGTPGSTFAGYLNGFTTDQLKQKAFFFGTPIASTGDTAYLTKGDNNLLTWTKDKAEAVELRLTKSYADNDLVRHFTVYKGLDGDQVVSKVDTLNFHIYGITDVATDQILAYNTTSKSYELRVRASGESVLGVVLKNKSADTYNIAYSNAGLTLVAKGKTYDINAAGKVVPGSTYKATEAFVTNYDFNTAVKLYGAHNSNTLVDAQSLYEYTENDLFTITDAAADVYRPVAALDTIKIFRNSDNNYLLYEKESFLGLENIMDPAYAKKNGALLADTAAGYGTWRPQYLLAVGTEQANGSVSGRYLVNTVDSAKAYGIDKKGNPFIHEYYQSAQPYYKLAFVNATHTGNSLIIAGDTINLENNLVDKVATFAFRYVDTNRDAFRIETAYENQYYETEAEAGTDHNIGDLKATIPGYVKYHNGVPVVTSKASEAEVFDLESLTGVIPTANETIADATEAVKVIAGNGTVTVQGAAGKQVIVSNILGKVIAETVLTSDNATIAVPAGIVAVKVEGEAAAKVVVK